MLSFLVRAFSRIYLLIDRRRRGISGPAGQQTAFGHDTNYPFF